MGVLPADSKKHLPDPFHFLMENPESTIIDFYPKDFEQDMNGKKFAWQATVILPFIDESRLLEACNSVYPQLTEDETRRNSVGSELLFLGSNNPLCPQIVELYTVNASDESTNTIDTKPSKGVSGTIARDVNFVPHSTYPSPLISENKPDIHNERAFCALYKMIQPPESFVYPAVLLPGVQLPRRVLNNFDIANTENNASRSKRNGNDYSRHEYFPGRDNNAGYGPQRDDHYVNHDLEPQVYKAPRNNHSQSERGGYRGGYRGQNNNQYNNYGQHHGHQQGYHNNSGQRYQNNQYGHGNQNAGYGSHNNQGRGNYHHGGNNNAGYQPNQYQGGQHGYHPGPYASQSHHQGGSYNNRGGYSHNNSRGRGGRGNYRGNY
jgi:5'-3' exoribonuclease 2